jgi:hypothetical protein
VFLLGKQNNQLRPLHKSTQLRKKTPDTEESTQLLLLSLVKQTRWYERGSFGKTSRALHHAVHFKKYGLSLILLD